jgi:hypothetical protein
MDIAKRQELTKTLQQMVGKIAADLRPRLLEAGPGRTRAERLHAEEKVGDAFDPWTDLLARRSAVLWVLKTVYVRVLEDRGMLSPKRLVDQGSEDLFARLAPNLGPSSYLRWVFRDLAMPESGLADLFVPQPAEILSPSDARSRELIDLWRSRDPDTGVLRFSFADETFDSRLMGDLYQDLDPVVKKRFALLQTPDFVLDFILDQTLTPAIAEHGADVVRVLDPACGSGHFLLAALTRIVAAMREKEPERPAHEVVKHAMRRVVGIDLNDYACGLARARLVMKGLELAGDTNLALAEDLHPQVFWADGLEQIELDQLGQTSLGLGADVAGEIRSTASMTRPEVRVALRPLLRARFHVVVGNPPYITEKDKQKKEYHREKVGKHRRYVSAAGTYSLGAPFTERMMQLCVAGGWMGEITANSFMKREFGKALIEDVLPKYVLAKVVDTAGAYIPGHGTPTVILLVRNRTSTGIETVPVAMGKRGEPGKPKDPARGRVWLSIVEGHDTVGYESEFISVSAVPRATLSEHPWSIGGGGAAELKQALEGGGRAILGATIAMPIGGGSRMGADEAYVRPRRRGAATTSAKPLVVGDGVRAWAVEITEQTLFPYDRETLAPSPGPSLLRELWPYREFLAQRATFDGVMADAGMKWFEYMQFTPAPLRTPLSITFGEVATHNEFALDRGGRVFKQTAPVIKLPAGASVEQHLALLAQLNSSVACFWLKQVCQNKGFGGARGTEGNMRLRYDDWAEFFQFGGTKVEQFPLAATRDRRLEAFAEHLDRLANERREHSARAVVDGAAAGGAAALRAALDTRRSSDLDRLFRMVGLQEELDWLCYQIYGVDTLQLTGVPANELRDAQDTPPSRPGGRPFEITLARDDAERRAAIDAGDEPEEQPTGWFERHGWEPIVDTAALPDAQRAVTEARIARTADSRELSLLDHPKYKRRWSAPDFETEERAALTEWLDDAIEDWSRERQAPFTAREAATALGTAPSVNAVVAVLHGRGDFDLDSVIAARLAEESVPGVKSHVYKGLGLDRRAAWERVWALQHEEDRWDAAVAAGTPLPGPRPVAIPAERYDGKDFQKPTYWKHRGKLDVPKERFIAYTEVPAAVSPDPLYGWAGWTPIQRARVLLQLDERAEENGVPADERIGLLWGAWFLVPYIAWDNPAFANEVAATVKTYAGPDGVTDARLAEWAEKWGAERARVPSRSPTKARSAGGRSPADR